MKMSWSAMAIASDAGPKPTQTRSRRVSGVERESAVLDVVVRGRCMFSSSELRDRIPFE